MFILWLTVLIEEPTSAVGRFVFEYSEIYQSRNRDSIFVYQYMHANSHKTPRTQKWVYNPQKWT
jgi:hypothetical protein